MAFDWVPFLRQHHIEYVEEGPSVVRGNIAIHCPLCGASDGSHHMGLLVEGPGRGAWGCWRNGSHRGKSPQKLIQALIGCSYSEASRIAGVKAAVELGDDASLGDEMKKLLGGVDSVDTTIEPIAFPKEFREVHYSGYGRKFIDYLVMKRDYPHDDALNLCARYDLRFVTHGPFAYRLVLPVDMPDVGLVGWTGRSIIKDEKLRYKSLSDKPETAEREGLPCAPVNIKDCVWNWSKLAKNRKHETLVVVEGPLDALRVDYYGRQFGIRSTCLFSKSLSQAQEEILGDLSKRFVHKVVLVDADAQTDAFGLFTRLERFGFSYKLLEDGDPAEMSEGQIKRLRTGATKV